MMGVIACQPVRAPDQARSEAVVSWIYDGDTVQVETGGQQIDVRLVGINAPESDECFGNEALDHLIENLKGRSVDMETLGTDQFDRTLAHLYVEGMNVGLDLVENGFAIALTVEGDNSEFLSAETAAAGAGLGLWGTEVCGGTGPLPDLSIDFDRFDEEVIVTNQGPTAVDVAEWVIRDESSRHRFRFAEATLSRPGETLVIRTTDPGWDPGDANVWNNDGDMAMLLDAFGRVVDHQRRP